MKKQVYFLGFWQLLTLLLATSIVVAEEKTLPEKDEGNLGEVKYSILSVDEFQRLYGPEWVLMAGQSLEGTDLYQEFGRASLPDARGLFLRGKNNERSDGFGNPEGDFEIGQYQIDQNQRHNHNETHSEDYFFKTVRMAPGEIVGGMLPGWAFSDGGASAIGRSRHLTLGGPESRPRNITVNIFVKVNRVKIDHKTETLLTRIDAFPKYLIENKNFLTVLNAYIDKAVAEKIKQIKQ